MDVSIREYLNKIREKNKEYKIKYDNMIINCPYITSKKELDKLILILDEIKDENKDFYLYIIDVLKTSDDLDEIFLLYKEYTNAKKREELLEKEIINKNKEFDVIDETLKDTDYKIVDFTKETNKLKDMSKILDDLSSTVSIKLDSLFLKIEKEESASISSISKMLLALTSFMAFKNSKNILGTVVGTYLTYKVLEELFKPKKDKYLSLCEDYISTLEEYKDNAIGLEKELVNSLERVEDLEDGLKEEYKDYINETQFKNIFRLITDIKSTVKRSLKDIDKTKSNIDKNIDDSKDKVKVLDS